MNRFGPEARENRSLSMRYEFKLGNILLYVATTLMLIGGIGDVLFTYINPGMIPSHLDFLNIQEAEASPKLIALTHSMLRAIGGLLIALAIGSFFLLYFRKSVSKIGATLVVTLIILIGEGNNAWQMYMVESPLFWYPLSICIISLVGLVLAYFGERNSERPKTTG